MIICILLNWNGYHDTVECLATLKDASCRAPKMVVVDNGSTDDSVKRIRATHPDVTLIATGKNLGFAGGSNCGIRYALETGAEYIWLLNNDTQPCPDALEQMLAVARGAPRIGAVGSVLCYADRPDVVQSWGGGRVKLWAGFNAVARSPRLDEWFDYLCAGSMLVRREALLDIGLLDEGFFLYWEDVDFGFRLRRAGWKLAVAGKAVVYHKENASTGWNSARRDRYTTASCLTFLRKWSPIPTAAMSVFLVSRLAKRIVTGQVKRIAAVCCGALDYRATRPLRREMK